MIHRPRVFIDVNHGEEPLGRLVIELFTDQTPKTCENFRAICVGSNAGLSYKASPFHRVIDEFMVQGGDITAGDGTGGNSIYDGEFEDENVNWREIDTEGLVCMANRGKGTNSSQFFITLTECPHLNGKHTIFGHLVKGQDILRRMAKVDVDDNDRPLTPLLIAHCGELERRKKPTQPEPSSHPPSRAIEDADHHRGRHKRRHSDSPVRSASPPRSQSRSRAKYRKKDRRRSDLSLDSTLRGRALKRGASESVSPVREDENMGAANKRRKQRTHQRNPSPSRGSEGGRQGRRRSSLPNQELHDRVKEKQREQRGDEDREAERSDERDFGSRRRRDDRGRDNARGRYDQERPREEDMEWEGRRRDFDDRDRRYRGDSWRNDGRLGGEREEASEGGIKFKGRGSMKFRERW
ncbi:MAG: hypothetical protein M1821_005063 [Bathelium mastoideum]|nr:MAG: hypothetical protein M1821_005063 [Bathelium mastoideum]